VQQLLPQQSSHVGQQQVSLVHSFFSDLLLKLLVAYTEAPASIIAAVTPMIIFFIIIVLIFE